MSAHTPGPWHYGEGLGTRNRLHPSVSADSGQSICSCRTDNKRANARLISTAPELLLLAYQYLSDMRHPITDAGSISRRIAAIEAVIAKGENA